MDMCRLSEAFTSYDKMCLDSLDRRGAHGSAARLNME